MLKGIHMQADWLRHGPHELLEEARRLLDGPPPPRIYLTGCGDSHFAGIGARLAFERWSGIPTQAVESLELSRYELELAPAGSWVGLRVELGPRRAHRRGGRGGAQTRPDGDRRDLRRGEPPRADRPR